MARNHTIPMDALADQFQAKSTDEATIGLLAPAKMPKTLSGNPRFATRESGMEAGRVLGMPSGTTNE